MSDRTNDRERADRIVGEGIKARFRGLDSYVPPEPPFERIEGTARSAREASDLVAPALAPRFRGNAGASVALVGAAAIVVLVLGSGLWGSRNGSSSAASPSPMASITMSSRAAASATVDGSTSAEATKTPPARPSSGCSIPPSRAAVACASSGATSGATNAVAAGSGTGGSPKIVFSQIGGNASWSPSGSRVAFTTGDTTSPLHSRIVDSGGKTIDTVAAAYVVWIDDDTYLGFAINSDFIAYHGFLGHVGSTTQSPLPGIYYVDPLGTTVAGGGVVALPLDAHHDKYSVWSASGISGARSGDPRAVSPDGKLLAVTHFSSSTPSRLDVVQADNGDTVASYTESGLPWTNQVFGFSPDSRQVAFALDPLDGVGRLGVLDVGSARLSVVGSCETQAAVWLSDTRLLASTSSPCEAPAESGVTVSTTAALSIAASSDGKTAGVFCTGGCVDAAAALQVRLQNASGGLGTIDVTAWPLRLQLSWSPDGSLLLIEYLGAGDDSNPPAYVAIIRP